MTRTHPQSAHVGKIVGALTALACIASSIATAHAANSVAFKLVRSKGLASDPGCAPNAFATVKISKLSPVDFAEKMTVKVGGLVSGTQLDLFVIQVPNGPFGISWYVGDLDASGTARSFVSRFSKETFAVAPGSVAAPNTHPGKDDTSNPPFNPIHTYHVGIWFNPRTRG